MIATLMISLHFLFDWVLQSREVAVNKKTDISMLTKHYFLNVLPYISIISIIFVFMYGFSMNIAYFWIINCLSHYFIDMLLPTGKTQRALINWTALDQVLHLGILFLTYEYFILVYEFIIF